MRKVLLLCMSVLFLPGCASTVVKVLSRTPVMDQIWNTGNPEIYEQIGLMMPAGDGVTPIVLRETKLTVDVEIQVGDNVVSGYLLIDTGLEQSFLDYGAFRHAVQPEQKTNYMVAQKTPDGKRARGHGYTIGEVRAEGFTITPGLWKMLDFSKSRFYFFSDPRHMDGYLGMLGRDVLLRNPIEFDFPEMQILLSYDESKLSEYTRWQLWDGDYGNPDWPIGSGAIWHEEGQYPIIIDTGAYISFLPLPKMERMAAAGETGKWVRIDAITPSRRDYRTVFGTGQEYSISDGQKALEFHDSRLRSQNFNDFEHTLGMQDLYHYSFLFHPAEEEVYTRRSESVDPEVAKVFSDRDQHYFMNALDDSPNYGFATANTDEGVLVIEAIRTYDNLEVERPEPGDYLVAVNGREIYSGGAIGDHESAEFTFRKKRRILPDREYTLTLEQFDYAQYLRELE